MAGLWLLPRRPTTSARLFAHRLTRDILLQALPALPVRRGRRNRPGHATPCAQSHKRWSGTIRPLRQQFLPVVPGAKRLYPLIGLQDREKEGQDCFGNDISTRFCRSESITATSAAPCFTNGRTDCISAVCMLLARRDNSSLV